MTSMNRSVSATDRRSPSSAFAFQPDDRERSDGREHREPAVERVRHLALDIPMRPPGLARSPHRTVRSRSAARPLIPGTGNPA